MLKHPGTVPEYIKGSQRTVYGHKIGDIREVGDQAAGTARAEGCIYII